MYMTGSLGFVGDFFYSGHLKENWMASLQSLRPEKINFDQGSIFEPFDFRFTSQDISSGNNEAELRNFVVNSAYCMLLNEHWMGASQPVVIGKANVGRDAFSKT